MTERTRKIRRKFTYQEATQELQGLFKLINRMTEIQVAHSMLRRRLNQSLNEPTKWQRLHASFKKVAEIADKYHQRIWERGVFTLDELHGMVIFPMETPSGIVGAYLYRSGEKKEIYTWATKEEINDDLDNEPMPSKLLIGVVRPIPEEWKQI